MRMNIVEVCVAGLCGVVLFVMVAVASEQFDEEAGMVQCTANLHRIGQMYTAFMADHEGKFPVEGDYNNYPDYQPEPNGGGSPPYMRRHPDAVLGGPHSGPWSFCEKLAAYDPDPNAWLCPTQTAAHGWFNKEASRKNEPYHPTVYTHYLQAWGVGDQRVDTLPGAPADVFVLSHGSWAMIGGSGLFDNAYNLNPNAAKTAFVHHRDLVNDRVIQREAPGGPLDLARFGKNGYLFADLHVEYLRYWEVLEGTRPESEPGRRDAKYFMHAPKPQEIGVPVRAEVENP